MTSPASPPPPPLYLIRFSQTHTTFRPAELEALERLLNGSLRTGSKSVNELSERLGSYGLDPRSVTVKVEIVRYEDGSPFCVLRFKLFGGRKGSTHSSSNDGHASTAPEVTADEELMGLVARDFAMRGVQMKAIYEVWGMADAGGLLENGDRGSISNGSDTVSSAVTEAERQASVTTTGHQSPEFHPLYAKLHASTRQLSRHRWAPYQTSTTLKFKFTIDTFNHKRSTPEQRDIINSFAYLDFGGLVRMKDANQEWVVFEEWEGPPSAPVEDGLADSNMPHNNRRDLRTLYLGRTISAKTLRPVIDRHDLKKRPYISTTSMDAELALITANVALAAPGKIFIDPFCGTGGFLVAAAELGAWCLGSDIDGRSFRGKSDRGVDAGVGKNIKKYGLRNGFGGCLTSDLVNTPFRTDRRRWLDGIISDPPYGVREGLKVLGTRNPPAGVGDSGGPREPHLIDGVPAYTLPGYVAPKKPYSFNRMLDDVLDFASRTLVDGGRLAFWMPSANEDEAGQAVETPIPEHPALTLKHVCVQRFNRWSRSLLIYERNNGELEDILLREVETGLSKLDDGLRNADDLNPFRKRYFQAFAVNSNENAGG